LKEKQENFWKKHSKYILLSSFLIASLFNASKLILRLRPGRLERYIEDNISEFWYQYISHFIFCLLVFALITWFQNWKFTSGKFFSFKKMVLLFVFVVLVIFVSSRLHAHFFHLPRRFILFGYIARYGISTALILLINRILILIDESKERQSQIHRLEIEKVEAQHQQLKNQINPHFFFNTLNSLSGLVKQDADKAMDYISYLSKIFRQSLSHQPDLVSLKSEIEFLDYYIKLQKLRFGEAFKIDLELSLGQYDKQVLSMGLQTLLENALKHNTLSKQKPLEIKIFTKDNYIWVSNNLQPKQLPVRGENFGLSSLQKRSKWVQDKDIIIKKNETDFCVGLALT
jgi:sensor histidine kinase YesM